MQILILGGSGQVGRELQASAEQARYTLVCPTRAELDICDGQALHEFMLELRPEICVNLAAYTDVTAAEGDPDAAFRVNCEGPAHLADASESLEIPLVHVSTDYVFDGLIERPYREDDLPSPLNVYGSSKLAGEREVRSRCRRHAIVRTSWVFSRWRRNFVQTVFERTCSGGELEVVDDEFGGPTSAADLAAALLSIARIHGSGLGIPAGIYHCSNTGSASRFEVADRIVNRIRHRAGDDRVAAQIRAVSTSSRPSLVRRPRYSVLDTGRIWRRLGIRLRPWTLAVDEVVDELLAIRHP